MSRFFRDTHRKFEEKLTHGNNRKIPSVCNVHPPTLREDLKMAPKDNRPRAHYIIRHVITKDKAISFFSARLVQGSYGLCFCVIK